MNPFKEDKANQLETISLLLLVIISINGVHDATYVDNGFVPFGVTESISNFIHLIIAIILSVIPVTIIFLIAFGILSTIVRLFWISIYSGFRLFRVKKKTNSQLN